MEKPKFEHIDIDQQAFDRTTEIQAMVLDLDVWPWLEGLEVNDELRSKIFERVCFVSGKMLTACISPGHFDLLVQEYNS